MFPVGCPYVDVVIHGLTMLHASGPGIALLEGGDAREAVSARRRGAGERIL